MEVRGTGLCQERFYTVRSEGDSPAVPEKPGGAHILTKEAIMRYCFSTEVVDLDNQAPNRNKRESRYFFDELNHLLAAGGFHSMEVPYEAKWDFGGRSGIPRSLRSVKVKFGTVASYMDYLKENGIDSIDCVHLNPSLFCQGMLPMFLGATQHYGEEAILFAEEAGCGVVTLTVTPPAFAVKKVLGELTEEAFLEEIRQLVSRLAAFAKEHGVTLCLKNEFWGLLRGEKITAFLDSIDGDVKLDLDTANLVIAGADVSAVIEANKGRIGIVHFTDTSFTDEDETWKTALPEFPAGRATKVFTDPGFGSVDLKRIEDQLKAAGYDGVIVMNPRNSYDISRSILRTRYYIDTVLA